MNSRIDRQRDLRLADECTRTIYNRKDGRTVRKVFLIQRVVWCHDFATRRSGAETRT